MKITKLLCITAALLIAGAFAIRPANAQSSSFGNFDIDRGLVIGVTVGAAAVVGGLVITYFVLHNRGVMAGCIAESAGKRTLVSSDKQVYTLIETGASPPVGERVKLKGHKSGSSSDRSFQVVKVLKDYGPCRP